MPEMKHTDSRNNSPSWKFEYQLLFTLMVITTVVFWTTDLDLLLSSQFYEPNNPVNHWPATEHPFWKFLYDSAPVIVTSLFLSCAFILLFVRKTSKNRKRLRVYSVFLLLIIVFGPGYIVNGVLKGYWARPRPADTLTLGGQQPYLPPLQMGNILKFKSFPSGHASSAFIFTGFFFIWRRRRKKLAIIALIGSVSFGLLMGMTRIMQGGHYLSDVLWAGFLTFLTASVLYHFVLKIPQREDEIESDGAQPAPVTSTRTKWVYTTIVLSLTAAAMMASPIYEKVNAEIPLVNNNKSSIVNYSFDQGDVVVRVMDSPGVILTIEGIADGFGLFTNKVNTNFQKNGKNLYGSLEHSGLFSELFANYVVKVNLNNISRLNLKNHNGNITVDTPLTENQKSKLDFNAKQGKVTWAEK